MCVYVCAHMLHMKYDLSISCFIISACFLLYMFEITEINQSKDEVIDQTAGVEGFLSDRMTDASGTIILT